MWTEVCAREFFGGATVRSTRRRRGGLSLGAVDNLQLFAGLEDRDFLGGHFNLLAGIRIAAGPPRRSRVRKLPKPRISIFSPFCKEPMMLSKIVSTMVSDSLRGSP